MLFHSKIRFTGSRIRKMSQRSCKLPSDLMIPCPGQENSHFYIAVLKNSTLWGPTNFKNNSFVPHWAAAWSQSLHGNVSSTATTRSNFQRQWNPSILCLSWQKVFHKTDGDSIVRWVQSMARQENRLTHLEAIHRKCKRTWHKRPNKLVERF